MKILTHLVVREDAHVLYGFMTATERELFRLLINTVSGIGPKIALNILSGITVTAFRGAVAGGDAKMLSQISGVGKKTAERIIIELKDKIGPGGALEAQSAQRALSADEQKINDAVLALVALGYKPAEAHETIRATQALLGPAAGVEELVRASSEKGSMMAVKPRRFSGVVVPHALPWHRRLAAFVLAGFLRLCIQHLAPSLEGVASRPEAPEKTGDLLRLAQSHSARAGVLRISPGPNGRTMDWPQ